MQRMIVICGIAIGHVVLALLLMREPIALHKLRPEATPIMAEILMTDDGAKSAPVSELTTPELPVVLAPPSLPADTSEPQRDMPRIDPEVRPDIASFSARAQLAPGTTATVMLTLEIAPDGSVMSAQVVRSNAGEAANEAAIDYARTTRWSPGMIDGEPHAMQASLTVILGENG
jgi:TonB family protein